MKKDVFVSILGLYSEENGENAKGERDSLEMLTPAECYQKENTYYVFYDEILGDAGNITKCRMKFSDKTFELTRKGEVSTQLLFIEGKKTFSAYHMPYGILNIGLDTKRVTIEEKEEEIQIHIAYVMEMDYQAISENEIHIVIKETGCQN